MSSLPELEKLTTSELEDLLSGPKDVDLETQYSIAALIAERAYSRQDYEAMGKWYEQLAETAQENESFEVEANARYKIGFAYFLNDKYEEAIRAYSEAEEIYSSINDDKNYLECLRAKLDSFYCQDSFNIAIQIGEEIISKSLVVGEFRMAGIAAFGIAKAYEKIDNAQFADLMGSNIQSAKHYSELAKQYFENTGDYISLNELNVFISDLDSEMNLPARLELINESIELIESKQKKTWSENIELADYLEIRGRINLRFDQLEKAKDDFLSAINIYTELEEDDENFWENLGVCNWQLSTVLIRQERYEEAIGYISRALNFALLIHDDNFYYRLHEDLAWAHFQLGNNALAVRTCSDAIDKYETENSFDSWIYFGLLEKKATILVWLELWDLADEILKKIESIDDYFAPLNRAVRVDTLRAQIALGTGNTEEAFRILNAVLGDYSDNEYTDEDIANCFELRGKILLERNDEKGFQDFENAINYYTKTNEHDEIERLGELLKSLNRQAK